MRIPESWEQVVTAVLSLLLLGAFSAGMTRLLTWESRRNKEKAIARLEARRKQEQAPSETKQA